jgi:hypothetical protein
MSQQLQNEIVKKYDENDAHFAQWAIQKIQDHFAAMKPSRSKIDPERLGSQTVLISKVKMALLDKVGPLLPAGVAPWERGSDASAVASEGGKKRGAVAAASLPNNSRHSVTMASYCLFSFCPWGRFGFVASSQSGPSRKKRGGVCPGACATEH